ncbi:unnamed protein product [Cyprideis torosa]|nr:unnamed protein product [Cyprideis torosa]CAG0886761.1 unnamed protein product [Cyprideis torosa]
MARVIFWHRSPVLGLVAAGFCFLCAIYLFSSGPSCSPETRFTIVKDGSDQSRLMSSGLKLVSWDRRVPVNQTASGTTREVVVKTGDGHEFHYARHTTPLIFIGGMPRSGTTLMRAMLDAHPEIRCGEETRVVPRLLQMRSRWIKSEKESVRLEEAGLGKEVLDSGIAAFILEIIARHGEPAKRLCNKDPFTLKSGQYLTELFPKLKFIFMIRDGRATVHSIISRKVTISGFDLNSYRQCLKRWNAAVETMDSQCTLMGEDRCLRVRYEQLVLHPEEQMRAILSFLEVPWNDSVLHHEEYINKPGGVSLSKVERSSDQVIRPVNLEALSKWVGKIPDDVVKDMENIAPMLAHFGYDPEANPPKYGDPDWWVLQETKRVLTQEEIWKKKAEELLASKRRANQGLQEEEGEPFDEDVQSPAKKS